MDEEKPANNHQPSAINHPLWWYIATWFGCGLQPISGTVGSLAALPVAYVIQVYGGNIALFAASLLIFLLGWWASNQYLKANGGEDPKEIVVDEVAGQWLLLSVFFPTWHSYLVCFVLFRAFDIIKPWPVSWADREVPGALGVMFDDMLAALYPILVYLFILVEAQLLGSQAQLLKFMNFMGGSYVHP